MADRRGRAVAPVTHRVECDFCGRQCLGYLEIKMAWREGGDGTERVLHACRARGGGDVGCDQRFRVRLEEARRELRKERAAS